MIGGWLVPSLRETAAKGKDGLEKSYYNMLDVS